MSSVSRSLAGVVLNFEAGLNLNLAPVPVGEGVMVGELDRTTEVEPFLAGPVGVFSLDEDLRIVAPVSRPGVEVLRSRISSSNFCRRGVEFMSPEFSFLLPSMPTSLPRDLSASGFLSAGILALFETSRSASLVGDFSSAVLDLLFVEEGGMASSGSLLIKDLFSDAVKAFTDPPDVLILLRWRDFSRTSRSVWGIFSDTQLVFCGGSRGRWLTGAIGPSCRNGTLRLRRRWGDFSGEDDSPADD